MRPSGNSALADIPMKVGSSAVEIKDDVAFDVISQWQGIFSSARGENRWKLTLRQATGRLGGGRS